MTVFLRILDASVEEKPEALLRAVTSLRREEGPPVGRTIFETSPDEFAAVPGSPFAYWVSEAVLEIFRKAPALHSSCTPVVSTNPLNDDFRYIRAWWEVASAHALEWKAWAKGGAYSPIYYDVDTVVHWDPVRESYLGFIGTESRQRIRPVASAQYFFRPGLTWPRRTNGLSFRVLASGSIFADKGPALFAAEDDHDRLLALSAVLNSRVFEYLVGVQLARTELAQSYEVGLIQLTPVPNLSSEHTAALARLARRVWSLKRTIDTSNETSHAFLLPQSLSEKITGLDRVSVERELEAIQKLIDDAVFKLYGIGPEDRSVIESSSKRTTSSDAAVAAESGDDGEESNDETFAEFGWAASPVYSWLVGVAFGRFDPRFATNLVDAYRTSDAPLYTLLHGRRAVPREPEPFDRLPTRSPGMWPGDEVPVVVPPDIMVDDPGHNDDLRTRVAGAAAHTGIPDPEDLRRWLANEFFPLHIKMYSRSRRKAPIYWQLATPSATYSVWLYIHAFSKDTLFRVQNDYVGGEQGKLRHEERRLESLTSDLRDGATAAQRKALAVQEAFVEELRVFLDDVKRVAPLWNPNLDDGVLINFAPLWRLVPQNKAWQKELKTTWDALCDGKFDWAYLAMHLWPERVVPKCAKDRSLAIAHGLEDVFWVEGTDGKWTARKTPTKTIEDLVKERTSPAVKAALKSLLEAPVASGKSAGRKGGRRGNAAAAADGGDA